MNGDYKNSFKNSILVKNNSKTHDTYCKQKICYQPLKNIPRKSLHNYVEQSVHLFKNKIN